MKQTAWEQSDWTYFFLFLPYRTARRPETRFGAEWVPGRCWRARCAREVSISYERTSWVNCGGFEATRGVSRGARIRDCTRMCLGATPAAAVRARDLPKYRRTGWAGCGGVEATRAGSARRPSQLNNFTPPKTPATPHKRRAARRRAAPTHPQRRPECLPSTPSTRGSCPRLV